MATLAESSGGGKGDDNEYVDRLIKRGDVTGLKRYNDQIQWAFQQKCQEHVSSLLKLLWKFEDFEKSIQWNA